LGTKFLQFYGGLLLFLCAALVLRVSFDAQPLDNLPKLAIAWVVFVLFEVGFLIWLRLRRRPIDYLDHINAVLGVGAVSVAFLTRGPVRLVGGLVWLGYQLLEGRLEERLATARAQRSEPGSGP
jgi:hypothetical protein